MAFLDKGLIKSTAQFFELLESGRIEPMFEDELDEQRLLRGENEELSAGRDVPVNSGDRDDVHIRAHRRVADDPTIRRDQNALRAVTQHIEQHMQALHGKPIELMWAIGQEVPPWRMPAPGGAPPGPGGPPMGGPPPPDGGPPGGGGGPPPKPVERARPMGGEPDPGLPLMPTNPSTGQRAPAGPPQ